MIEKIEIKELDYLLLPKNSGLLRWREQALQDLILPKGACILERRGEDVPRLVAEITEQGKSVIGITGDDLYDEARYRYPELMKKARLLNTTDWFDKKAVYGRPALALIGKKEGVLLDKSKMGAIGVPSKYRETSRRFLRSVYGKNFKDELVFVYSGSVEENISLGLYSFAIDIVYTGATLRESGLEILDVVRCSDISTIASKNIKYKILG